MLLVCNFLIGWLSWGYLTVLGNDRSVACKGRILDSLIHWSWTAILLLNHTNSFFMTRYSCKRLLSISCRTSCRIWSLIKGSYKFVSIEWLLDTAIMSIIAFTGLLNLLCFGPKIRLVWDCRTVLISELFRVGFHQVIINSGVVFASATDIITNLCGFNSSSWLHSCRWFLIDSLKLKIDWKLWLLLIKGLFLYVSLYSSKWVFITYIEPRLLFSSRVVQEDLILRSFSTGWWIFRRSFDITGLLALRYPWNTLNWSSCGIFDIILHRSLHW